MKLRGRKLPIHLVVVKGGLQNSLQDHWESLFLQIGVDATTSVLDVSGGAVQLPDHDDVIVLFPTPYMEHYPEPLSSLPPQVRVAYAGYGLPEICVWEQGEFGLDFFARVDYLMCASSREEQSFLAQGVSADRLRVTGNPLLHECLHLPAYVPSEERVVLWAPHWTREWVDGSRGFSNWYSTVHDLLACLELHEGLSIIVRPHGLLSLQETTDLPAYASELWSGDEFSVARDAFTALMAHPRVTASTLGLASDLLRCSDVITDGISMMGYAPAAGRRTAVVRRADSPALAEAGQQLCEAVSLVSAGVATCDWVGQGFSSDAADEVRSAARMRAVVRSVYPSPDLAPGQSLLAWIAESLSSD